MILAPISVLVVDDSAFMRKMVTQILMGAEGITVIGQAHNGVDALDKVTRLNPDVVTLDVEMPEMDGMTALKEIGSRSSARVVMLSSLTHSGAAITMKCLDLGAVDFVAKPAGSISLNIAEVGSELIAKVRAAASFRGVSDFPTARQVRTPRLLAGRRKGLVVIGSSTGGPRALQTVIPALPGDLGVPVVVVQHMPPTFTATLANRLDDMSPLHVREASAGDRLTAGQVLVAKGGFHLEFDAAGQAMLSDGPALHGVRPSVDVTLASLVRTFGRQMIGVLLTGMGCDGASGLKAIHNAGGVTIAESESTCVVYGMPKAAVEMGVVDRVVPIGGIPSAIVEAVEDSGTNLKAS